MAIAPLLLGLPKKTDTLKCIWLRFRNFCCMLMKCSFHLSRKATVGGRNYGGRDKTVYAWSKGVNSSTVQFISIAKYTFSMCAAKLKLGYKSSLQYHYRTNNYMAKDSSKERRKWQRWPILYSQLKWVSVRVRMLRLISMQGRHSYAVTVSQRQKQQIGRKHSKRQVKKCASIERNAMR